MSNRRQLSAWLTKPVSVAVFSVSLALALSGCASAPTRPTAWSAPEAIAAVSSFAGVHGLAIDRKGRLLAGSVTGSAIWEVDRRTGAARLFIPPGEGQADDIAVGPDGELAWTGFLQGVLRFRASDDAPIRVLAKDLPGINSLDFDRRNGKLYASQVFMGDALWEIDVGGAKPPRLIAKDLGGFNGFEVGPDGMLYGPLWFKRQVVKIDPANGAITVISGDFKTPAAANLDGKGNLWVVDAYTGELSRVDLASGRKTVARQLKPALDNLAIAPEGTIYISNMADNSIEAFDPATGELRLLTGGKLAVPAGLRIDGDRMWVADLFAFREVDLSSGKVSDVMRMQASDLQYPMGVGVSAQHLVLASGFTGTVHQIDRGTLKTSAMGHGFKGSVDAIPMPDGSILVAEMGSGSILRVSGPELKQRVEVVKGLNGPVKMTLGKDGALYVSEIAGSLTRVDLADGSKANVASGLALPKGIAQTPWGSFVVLEVGAKRLTEIDPTTGERRTVAANLPVGLAAPPGTPGITTGVAVDAQGNVYFSADLNSTVYKVRPQR
jgi:sugar lactone lactonase YvrE